MTKNKIQCFKCDGTDGDSIEELFGYFMCESCKSKLGLFQDQTIIRYKTKFDKAKEIDTDHFTYMEEINHRLEVMEKDYLSKRIKLLHIRDHLSNMK